MSYATYDFTESLDRVRVEPADIEAVVAAWGHGEGAGEDAGHYRWSECGVSEWHGGFLLRLKNGEFAYVRGWCDYTGWGCQDGAYEYRFDHEPSVEEMRKASAPDYGGNEPEPEAWDREPADLNRWLRSLPHV